MWQSFTPYLVYDTLEKKAYADYYGETKPVTGEFGGYVGSEHFTKEVINWQFLMFLNAAIWGPMWFFGMFSLSEMLYPVSKFWL